MSFVNVLDWTVVNKWIIEKYYLYLILITNTSYYKKTYHETFCSTIPPWALFKIQNHKSSPNPHWSTSKSALSEMPANYGIHYNSCSPRSNIAQPLIIIISRRGKNQSQHIWLDFWGENPFLILRPTDGAVLRSLSPTRTSMNTCFRYE